MFPSAKELRAKSNQTLEFMEELECIKGQLLDASSHGQNSLLYDLNDRTLFDPLSEYLTEKGYKVGWNGSSMWMEISW